MKNSLENQGDEEKRFIPIYQYCKNNNTSKQNVYRWIRERKINENDIKIEVRTVKRITIREDLIAPKKITK